MKLLFAKSLLLVSICMMLISCEKKVQMPSNKHILVDSSSADMVKLNKLLFDVEQEEIKSFVSESKLDFKETKLGVWYAILETGNGPEVRKNDAIVIDYIVKTLHGELCYDYTMTKQQKMVVGKSQREHGFNDALTLLREGDKAVFVVPSNLCFGMLGDANKVPPRTALVYTINAIKIKK